MKMRNVWFSTLAVALIFAGAQHAQVWEPPPGEIRVVDDAYVTQQDTMLIVPAPGPLTNDSSSDSELQGLRFTLLTGDEFCLSLPDGTLAVCPPHLGYLGVATLRYQVTDASGRVGQGTITVTITEDGTVTKKSKVPPKAGKSDAGHSVAIANVLDGLAFKNPTSPKENYLVRAVGR